MGEIVFGAGTSHSPMLLLGAEQWLEWGARGDAAMADLADGDGVVRTFGDWSALRRDRIEPELAEEVLRAKSARCAEATKELARRIEHARLDALIIIGDDQGEHLDSTNLPPILIHHGATVQNAPSTEHADAPPIVRQVFDGYYEPDEVREYPIDTDLAEHLIDSLLDTGFDIASSDRLPADRPEGHAFQYVHRHLMPDRLASVLVMLNTYMPPAQPRARRCVQLGEAIRTAVRSLDGDRRVGVIASGGLSHFLIDEDFDQLILDAFAKHDHEALSSIPERALQSGSSEIKNWIAAAGACGHLDFSLIDYVPGYRTTAGTGTALAFATWQSP